MPAMRAGGAGGQSAGHGVGGETDAPVFDVVDAAVFGHLCGGDDV